MTKWLKSKWLAGLVVLFVMPTWAQVFDLSADFSLAKNPNAVWEYGFSATSSLSADRFQLDQKSVMIGPIGFWHPTQGDAPGPGYYPYIAYNSTKDTPCTRSHEANEAVLAGIAGNPYSGASLSATLVNAQGFPIGSAITPNGQAYTAKGVTATLDSTGHFSVQLVPNTILSNPSGTQWRITIDAPSDQTIFTYEPAWRINFQTAITATVDLSTQLSGLANPINFMNAKTGQSTIATSNVDPTARSAAAAAQTTANTAQGTANSAQTTANTAQGTASTAQTTATTAQTTANSAVPLAGGQMTGTLKTPLAINKLPRVNVTHPDFGVGCANAADPTGVLDSTCAIDNAVTFASATAQHLGNGVAPSLYFPHGYYKISGDPRIPCGIHTIGDGSNASIIEEVNNTEGVTIIVTLFQPDSWDCNGSLEGIGFYTPNDHLYTATQLQILNDSGYRLRDVRVAGGGGRGLALVGDTERTKAWGLEIDTVRWPLIWSGNENHLWGLNIAAPGQAASGYCFGQNNCVNGVFPNLNWTGGTLISANGNGTTASFYVRGNATFTSTSPLVVGHHFQVSGTTGTVLDGMYQVTAAMNSVASDPSGLCTSGSPCFEVQAASATSGTATVAGATWLPAILPERTAAVSAGGANWELEGGSVKNLWYTGGFEVLSTFGSRLADFYTEGLPLHGDGHENSDIVEGGLPPQTMLTQALPASTSATSATVASTLWFHNFVNDASDAQGSVGGAQIKIVPQDFLKGSTAASAFVAGVQRGQFEVLFGSFAGDGKFYILQRMFSGSTAPANTPWPVGSIIAEVPQANLGTLEVVGNHMNAIDAPGSNWAVDCADNSVLVCGSVIAGTIPNGVTTFTTGQGNPGVAANLHFVAGDWFSGGTETQGNGYIKARGAGAIIDLSGSGYFAGGAFGNSGTTGQLFGNVSAGFPQFVNVQEADGSFPNTVFENLDTGTYFNSSTNNFTKYIDANGASDPVTGSGALLGRQFTNEWCYYDTPVSGGTHSLNRWCYIGGPISSGSQVGWEFDTWSGTAWVNAFAVNPNSTDTGGQFSGYIGNQFPQTSQSNTWTGQQSFAAQTSFTPTCTATSSTPYCGTSTSAATFEWSWWNGTAAVAGNCRIAMQGSATNPSLSISCTTPSGQNQPVVNLASGIAGISLPQITGVSGEGKATLAAGTTTVSTTAASTTANITLTNCGANSSTAIGTPSVASVIAGTSFVINSLSAANAVVTGDTSTVCWWIH